MVDVFWMKMNKEKLTLIRMMGMTLLSIAGMALAYYIGSPIVPVVFSFGSVVYNYQSIASIINKE